MTRNYEVIELDKESVMLKLPSFYSRYAGTYFYYQQRKKYDADNTEIKYIEFDFHLNKNDAKEVDENGILLPILMCHITENGRLPCPDEILKVIKENDNKVYFYSKGYSDFSLSTAVKSEVETGVIAEDEEYLIKLFNN